MSELKEVWIDAEVSVAKFGPSERYPVEDLRAVLHRGLISSGDPLIPKFGSRREKLGVIRVITPSDQMDLPLYRSTFKKNLYAVLFPQVGGEGYSITYFMGDELFETYLSVEDTRKGPVVSE